MGSRNNKPARIVKGTAKQPTLKEASGIWTLDEALQAHRANAWPQPNLFQPIPKSLRAKNYGGTNGTNGLRFGGRSSTPMQATFSGWVKRGHNNVAGDYWIFGSNQYSSSSTIPPMLEVIFKGANAGSNDHSITVAVENSSISYYTSTSALFRDMSAWYHIHVAYDATQATNTNRIKIWVNGIQLTAMSGSSWPPQGTVIGTQTPSLGCLYLNGAPTRFFDGHMAEINWVDGYALQPTLFGKFDTNNTWVPIPYTGSYGTSGFYLPFTNNTNSQTLGYDASLNGTTTYDADQDPYRGSVALHLTGNGPAGGQNNSFADSSSNNYSITRSGSVTQGSVSPFPLPANTPYNPAVNGASAYFDRGSSDNLQLPTAAGDLGSGDWTVECWWKSDGSQSNYSCIIGQGFTGSPSNGAWIFKVNNNGGALFNFSYYSSGISDNSSGIAVNDNSWYHLAASRSGTSLRLFVNGVLGTTITLSAGFTFGSTGATTYVGYNPRDNTYIKGNVCGLRIIKSAIYTAAFTPANQPFGTLTNNLITFSEDFTNATQYQITQISNADIAPDGTPSATRITENTASGVEHYWEQSNLVTTNATYTQSIYIKPISAPRGSFAFSPITVGMSPDVNNCTFNVSSTGVITTGSNQAGFTTTSTSVGNGWYRITATYTTSGTITSHRMRIFTTSSSGAFTGDGVSSFYIWGSQLEAAGSAGNYTPTPANFRTAPSLLLNFANAAVVDSAGAGNAVTVGNATITSSSKYGSGALTFNNSGTNTDYLNINNFDCTLAGNFTVEFWFRPQSTSTSYTDFAAILDTDASAGADINWWVIHQVNQTIYWATAGGAADLTTGNVFTTANEWYHVAFVRNNQKLSFYINGKEAASRSYTTTFGSVRQLRVGAQGSGSRGIRASIDDLRITKGVARYQDNFTPPARALPETGGKSFITQNVTVGTVRSFTTVGTTAWTAPYDVNQVEVLVVAGGGGSGGPGLRSGFGNSSSWSGGGGGGGVIYNSQYPVTPGQTYTVTVGAGGALDTNGGNSVFGNLTAIGGGAGGDSSNGSIGDPGSAGGSGGGGGGDIATAGGAGTAGQGFAGGVGQDPTPEAAGGGGGAGGVGAAGSGTGAGGIGLQFGISGTPTYYAGGGGGACGTQNKSTNTGGLGGGGNGSTLMYNNASNATAGTANTGGGGGGGPSVGGSGIVIVRYTTATEASHWSEDSLVDSPTLYGHDLQLGGEVVGNYATWSPLIVNGTGVASTFSNGNLTVTNTSGSGGNGASSFGTATGKWYYEAQAYGIAGGSHLIGILGSSTSLVALQNFGAIRSANSGWYDLAGNTTGGTTWTADGTTIGIAYDVDAGKCWFSINGVWVNSGSPAGGTNPAFTFTAGTSVRPWFAFDNQSGTKVFHANFGQRPWTYQAPAGFNALTTKNLPIPTGAAANPNQYFDAVLYTGTSSNVTVSNLNFQPDLIWVKARSNAQGHSLIDSVRGTSKLLQSNTTGAELTLTNLPTFNANGFTSTTDVHTNAYTYVAWCWKANGAAVSNTDGSITSQVSANTTSGFSIVSYTGTAASTVTIGHGLGVSPSFIILKNRDTVGNWYCYHSALGPTYRSSLNLTDTPFSPTGLWNSTAPSSTVFSTVQDGISFNNGSNHIAYCWSEVPGFSKFGSYTGNGSTDGPFVYLGFKPRYVLVKGVSNATDWNIIDTARDGVANTASNKDLITNATNAEASYGDFIWDFTSNGFKIRQISSAYNTASNSYIYAAFAENPFKTGRAR